VHTWRLVIEGVDGHNVLSGAITFGDAKPPEPASDPDGKYPPSESELPFQLVQGATYTIVDGAASGDLVRFEIAQTEVMKSWCELQTSYQVGADAYSCLPGWRPFGDECGNCVVVDSTGAVSTFPMTKCAQCAHCACDESSCTANRTWEMTFDLKLDAEAGTLTGKTSDGRSLRLTRVEDAEP
jgi:hypothetical protein